MTKIIKLKNIGEKEIIEKIKQNYIFIYPTDTLYGIGCNALNSNSVKKIREIKKSKKPFSVIAPSKQWISKNFKIEKKYLKKLPGPFTLILKMKRKNLVAKEANLNLNTLGVRIPNHRFTKIIQKAKVPFITTSINISGEQFITKVKEIPKEIFKKVDIVIDDGESNKAPSIIIDLTKKIPKIIKR